MEILKEIYLIRHGETEYNRMGKVQGSGIDAPLNDTGRKQARAFYDSYRHTGFDKIYVSALQRTWQTVEEFVKQGIPVEKHAGLNEISWGSFEDRQMGEFDKEYYHSLIRSWKNGNLDRKIEDGESPLDVMKRQKPVLQMIFSRPEEKKILICMHGRAMRIFLCLLMKKPVYQMEDFQHFNSGLYHIYVNSDNTITLNKENCIAHLGGVDD